MATLAAVARALYYPTNLRIVAGCLPYLKPGAQAATIRILDPCAGKGSAALFLSRLLAKEAAGHYQLITPDSQTIGQPIRNRLELYGIELNSLRAEIAAPGFTRLLCTDSTTARVQEGAFDLIWHNPPYDEDRSGEELGRLELQFLRRATRYLKPGGVLIHIIPMRRLKQAAEHLAHYYKNLQIFRFPAPEYGLFEQIVIFGEKRSRFCGDLDTTQYLKTLTGNQLPELPCPGLTRLETLLSQTRLPLTEEDQAELRQLREEFSLTTHNVSEQVSLAHSYTLPGSDGKEIIFRKGTYDPAEALSEARENGIWQNPTFRQNLIGNTHSRRLRPALPLREGQLALLIATGMLDNTQVTDNTGIPYLVKGKTLKEWVVKEVKRDTRGEIESQTERESLKLSICLRNLVTGHKEEIQPDKMGDFIRRFGASLRQKMLEIYPPLYLPGKTEQGSEIQKLETCLIKLRRKPLKAQRYAAVAAALSLIENGCATLSAEQGSGKSYLGAAAAWLSGAKRVLVVCPPHLVGKWVREVTLTIPGAKAEIVRDIKDLTGAVKRIQQHETVNRPDTGLPAPPYFVVMSRESMKLTHRRKAGAYLRQYRDDQGGYLEVLHCPCCGSPLTDKDGYTTLERLEKRKQKCNTLVRRWRWSAEHKRHFWNFEACGEELWQATGKGSGYPAYFGRTALAPSHTSAITSSAGNFVTAPYLYRRSAAQLRQRLGTPGLTPAAPPSGPRRVALSRYISRRLPHYFDLLIGDELHEFKSQESGQGISLGRLAESCGKVLGLTGTFSGGYASNLFFLLMRFSRTIREDYRYTGAEEWRFISEMGILERVVQPNDRNVDILEHGVVSDRISAGRARLSEKPGLNPRVLNYMLGHTIFLQLADVSSDLPPYQEHITPVEMEEEQAERYHYLETTLLSAVRQSLLEGSQRLLGVMVNTLLWWVDQPHQGELVIDPIVKPGLPPQINPRELSLSQARELLPANGIIASLEPTNSSQTFPKEAELIRLYHQEKALGRRLLVFVSNTQSRDITPRLKQILEMAGAKVAVLRSEVVEAKKREEWIEEQVANGTEVLIAQPVSVQTGMDLLAFQTIVWYQLHPSTFVMRQASRRSWRIGQKDPVHVYYLVYKDTAQYGLLNLMARKIQASQILEGNLSGDGLVGLADEDQEGSLVITLARQMLGQETENSPETNTHSSLEEILERLGAQELESSRFLLDETTDSDGADLAEMDELVRAGTEVATTVRVEQAIQEIYQHRFGKDAAAQSGNPIIKGEAEATTLSPSKSRPTFEELRELILTARAKNRQTKEKKTVSTHQLSLFDTLPDSSGNETEDLVQSTPDQIRQLPLF